MKIGRYEIWMGPVYLIMTAFGAFWLGLGLFQLITGMWLFEFLLGGVEDWFAVICSIEMIALGVAVVAYAFYDGGLVVYDMAKVESERDSRRRGIEQLGHEDMMVLIQERLFSVPEPESDPELVVVAVIGQMGPEKISGIIELVDPHCRATLIDHITRIDLVEDIDLQVFIVDDYMFRSSGRRRAGMYVESTEEQLEELEDAIPRGSKVLLFLATQVMSHVRLLWKKVDVALLSSIPMDPQALESIKYIPHLNFSVEDALWAVGREYSHTEWLEWDRPWLLACDAILVLASSPGADQERKWAEEAGLTVYESIDAIPALEVERG